jgi:hypothetical protein
MAASVSHSRRAAASWAAPHQSSSVHTLPVPTTAACGTNDAPDDVVVCVTPYAGMADDLMPCLIIRNVAPKRLAVVARTRAERGAAETASELVIRHPRARWQPTHMSAYSFAPAAIVSANQVGHLDADGAHCNRPFTWSVRASGDAVR